MIAKLIVHDETREAALEKLERRLIQARIAGPASNLAFLAALAGEPGFRAGNFDTSLIDRKLDDLTVCDAPDAAVLANGIAGLVRNQQQRLAKDCAGRQSPSSSPWHATDGFQISGFREVDHHYTLNGERQVARLRYEGSAVLVRSDDDEWVGPAQNVSVYDEGDKVYVVKDGRQSLFAPYHFTVSEDGDTTSGGAVTVPMHGKIIAVTVSNGDVVEKGDILFSVEAMKMEHAVLAPRDGEVESLAIAAGEQVENGHVALHLGAADEQQD